jgi:hypothetical protein
MVSAHPGHDRSAKTEVCYPVFSIRAKAPLAWAVAPTCRLGRRTLRRLSSRSRGWRMVFSSLPLTAVPAVWVVRGAAPRAHKRAEPRCAAAAPSPSCACYPRSRRRAPVQARLRAEPRKQPREHARVVGRKASDRLVLSHGRRTTATSMNRHKL